MPCSPAIDTSFPSSTSNISEAWFYWRFCSLFFFLSFYFSTRKLSVCQHDNVEKVGDKFSLRHFKNFSRPFTLFRRIWNRVNSLCFGELSFALSLSHTHTHIRARARTLAHAFALPRNPNLIYVRVYVTESYVQPWDRNNYLKLGFSVTRYRNVTSSVAVYRTCKSEWSQAESSLLNERNKSGPLKGKVTLVFRGKVSDKGFLRRNETPLLSCDLVRYKDHPFFIWDNWPDRGDQPSFDPLTRLSALNLTCQHGEKKILRGKRRRNCSGPIESTSLSLFPLRKELE